jgi:GNAT superfamily N-acetyltransferase
MTLFTYNEAENKQHWIDEIRKCDWGAAKFLADILEQNRVEELLGGGEVFILADGEKIVSFCTLTKNDCIKDDGLFPWIGFLFTREEYRGHAYSGLVLDAAYDLAMKNGHERVYLATDHIGFYEKFGFTYLENRIDIYGDDSRIYVK